MRVGDGERREEEEQRRRKNSRETEIGVADECYTYTAQTAGADERHTWLEDERKAPSID